MTERKDSVEWHAANYSKYKNFSSNIEELLRKLLKGMDVQVSSRAKDVDSLRRKVEASPEKYHGSIANITDLAGVRVMTLTLTQVDEVSKIIQDNFEIDKANSVDKRLATDPKVFGYSSLHFVVSHNRDRAKLPEFSEFKGMKCEIQIRTMLQHTWAEIEHDVEYKAQQDVPYELQRSFASLSALIELADREFNRLSIASLESKARAQEVISQGSLSLEINSDSLRAYIRSKFPDATISDMDLSEEIQEITCMGISSLEELNSVIEKTPRQFYSEIWSVYYASKGEEDEGGLYLPGLIRAALLYSDPEKYRNCAGSSWRIDALNESALEEMIDFAKKKT